MNYKNAYEEMKKLYELLQQENEQLKDNIRQMDNSIDKLQKLLIKEKDNWNKLKEYCEEAIFYYTTGNGKYKTEMMGNARNGIDILNKMQELEQGSD